MKSNVVFCTAVFLASMASYGALTNVDYVNETWELVWDGTPVTSLARNEKTYFYCHWESSLGRTMAADIHVCASPANAIKYPGAVQAIEPTEYGNCTYWIMRTDYSVPFDDIKRVYSINVGSSSSGGSSSVYHQIEKPNLYVYAGTTNMLISWSIGKQTDNSPIKAEIYRRQGEASSSEASYELVYAEYDPSNIRVTNGPANNNEWVDTSVKLGVTYTYFVRVYGRGGRIDYSNSYAKTGETTGRPLVYEGLRGATHQNPDYYVVGTELRFTEPSTIPCYTFAGWTPECVKTDQGLQVITANWENSRDTIWYNSNDGNGFVVYQDAQYDSTCEVQSNNFAKSGYAFQGWATEPNRDVFYVPGMMVSNLTDVADGVVDLYAVWSRYEMCDSVISDVSVESLENSGKFRINYTLSNRIDAQNYGLRFLYATGGRTNEIVNLEGDVSLDAGSHTITWVDESNAVILGQPSEVLVAIVGVGSVGDAIAQEQFTSKRYCIINLAQNENSEKWAIQYTNAVPAGGWTDEHKCNKMVFRRCPAGEFHFGSNEETEENIVTLTKDFYIGIFEVTRGQYAHIMGSCPSSGTYYQVGDLHPAFRVSYNDIRGSENGANWPTSSSVDNSSFMGVLRTNVGLLFDLPTEAQWEYACRAQTPTCYSYGYGPDPDGDYMWYKDNSSITVNAGSYTYPKTYMHEVGTRRPNQWGIYDMHGNVSELCLDRRLYYSPFYRLFYGNDPVGLSSEDGRNRALRGGDFRTDGEGCKTCVYSRLCDPSNKTDTVGFRVVINTNNDSDNPDCLTRVVSSTAASFLKPANPIFNPLSGTIFESSLSVSISCPTEGATIHYTTNGSIPTAESPEYRRFRITGKTTVKAVAVVGGMLSDIVTAEYALGQRATPTISLADGGEFSHSNQVVAIQWNDDGVLRYTLDGSEPTAGSPIYVGPFTINDSTTIKAKGFSDTFFDSPVVTASVTRVWENMTPPVIGVAATFTGTRTEVVISSEMDGATIFYTLDDSEPNSDSTRYTGPFYVTDSCTIKAYAAMPDYLDSVVVTAVVTRAWETVATPRIEATSPFTGSKAKVVLSCATEGALVRYTLNGNDPNSHSTKYTKPFYVTDSCTIKAYAVKADYLNSAVATQAIVKAWGIGDTMGKPDHAFSTSGLGGGTGFVRVADASAPDGEAMKSGAITHSQSSILSTTVMGAGTLAFSWRTSCEEDPLHEWDHAEFVVDGDVRLMRDGVTSWQNESVRIEGNGEHTVEWKYVKDDVESEGEDAAWIAGYQWMPDIMATRTTTVPVPYEWLAKHDPDVVDEYASYEASAKRQAANPRFTMEDAYVAGIDPADPQAEFKAEIDIVDGEVRIKWTPDLNTNKIDRIYTVLGKENLVDGKGWAPTNSTHRFFKVKIEMP